MKVFNAATEYIKHGGKRRGANMGILNIEHPDIEAFIHAKSVGNELDNFNISVGISDAFMKAVEGSSDWQLIHPKTKAVTSTVKARNLWNSIIENAWKTGDPGLVFLDTINENNPLPVSGRLEATNPCGELPLFPYEACNLGSINLARLVNNHGNIEWERLGRLVNTAIRFLDDVIDAGNYILPETLAIVHKNRKIGLGVMGWADLLVRQQIPYESEAALALAERIMKFLWQKSTEASEDLARERGSFPNWKNSIYYPSQPMRNATRLSIAPTGTISIIADTSPSIEPLFALAFQRKQVLNGQTLPEVNKYFLDYIKEFDLYTQELVDRVMSSGSIADVAGLPPEMKNIFRTALEVTPEWHLKHQVAFQKYIDNAVSKTINLPFQCTVDDVAYIYKMAWLQKAKGITIFRDQSKNRQVLEKGIIKKETACKTC